MDFWILAAGLLSTILVLAHVFGGGPEIHQPMLKSILPQAIKSVWTVVWHGITIILITGSVVLVYAGMRDGELVAAVWLICAQYLGFAALFLYYGITQLGTLWVMPQWTAFILIPVLAIIGLLRAVG